MRKKFLVILIIGVMIYTLIMGINNYAYYRKYNYLNEKIYDLRYISLNQCENLISYMYKYDNNKLGISKEQLNYIISNLNTNKRSFFDESRELTKEEALNDIDFLFNLIKHSYAGYEYFKGDFNFKNAKDSIINSINLNVNSKITSFDLEQLILSNLNFIQDGHFSVNNRSPLVKHVYYSNESIDVYQCKQGYYIKENGEKLFIESINDDVSLNKFLKLSINCKGNLCYYIGVLDEPNKSKIVSLKLKSKDEESLRHVSLKENHPILVDNNACGYDYYKKQGIPIVKLCRMYNINDSDKTMDSFIESSDLFKKNSIIILDIRGNVGGNDIAIINWFEKFKGQVPEIEKDSISLYSLINNQIGNTLSKNINYDLLPEDLKKEYNKEMDRFKSNQNQWYNLKSEERKLKNNTKIFVLIDNNVASSGENLIAYLKTLDNVFVVGTNSSGMLLSNVFTDIIMPNSKISIKFGNEICSYKDFKEGVGFQPDIWINNSDSLDKVLNFINKSFN